MAPEVERKFLFLPHRWMGTPTQSTVLEQGSLADTGAWDLRLVRTGVEGWFTLRSSSVPHHEEWKVPLSPTAFDDLWPQTQGRRTVGLRLQYPWKGHTLLVDQYRGALEGLTLVTVTFPHSKAARSLPIPSAFGPEVTYDPRFRPASLTELGSLPLGEPQAGDSGWSFGVLPFRKRSQGWELIVVSTRDGDRWIVPKGQPEPALSPEAVAVAEAEEEAGLTGRLAGHPLVLPYERETGTVNLLLFPFEVTRMADRWRESGQRERRVISVQEAGTYGPVVQAAAQWIQDQEEK